jgi:hypothetical protein
MKNDELYPFYLVYLDIRLSGLKISNGSYSLLKMSRSSFEDFKYKFENDELFSEKIIKIKTSEIRDKKIDDLFDDFN